MSINKVKNSYEEAIEAIFDEALIMIDGFGGPGGMPSGLIWALRNKGVRNLTIIGNCMGLPETIRKERVPPHGYVDCGVLFENKQVKKAVAAFPVSTAISFPVSPFEEQFIAGEVELEIVPQGTLAERIRAGGAGIGGFYVQTGTGADFEKGKEKRIINGKEHILEFPLRADFALIRAYKADPRGNLVYRGTSRSFNPLMAMAAKITIVEVEEIVELGELGAEAVDTPGIYVSRVVLTPKNLPLGIIWRYGGQDEDAIK